MKYNTQDEPVLNSPNYALIYVIHGDSDYLYHKDGKPYKADKEALKEAFEVALNAKKGEVFIFHQQPEKKAFLLFPKKDRTFYHYKNGDLVRMEKYSPLTGGLETELQFIEKNIASGIKRVSLFYFGHEIPENYSSAYHRSQPTADFNLDIFSEDLNKLAFSLDLIALSTCNNGTPEVAYKLSDHSEILIASPQNLHLSYLNTKKVLMMEQDHDISTLALADSIANNSFEELSSFIETDVTVSIYDLNTVSHYLEDLIALYSHKNETALSPNTSRSNMDCSDLEDVKPVLKNEGVVTYYSPSLFGRRSKKKSHSGWGCKP